MSQKVPSHSAWTEVDSTDDPDFFVRFLDFSRRPAVAAALADPQAYFAYLDVQPGQRILDAACGLGDLTRVLARLVGPQGEVVGVDFSATMVEEARRRAGNDDVPVRFERGDILALDYPDESFHRVRAEQILQHISSPETAISELVRVTRPGGLVAVLEPDWDTLVIDADDLAMSRAFALYNSDVVVAHGEIGRRLPALLRDLGLLDVAVTPTVLMPPYLAVREFIESNTRDAIEKGIMPRQQALAWMADLETRDAEGRFFAAFIHFQVVSRRPS